MFDQLFMLPPPFNMIVLLAAIVFTAEIVKALVKQTRVWADREADRRMKQDLIHSGMSVEEAERWARLELGRPAKPRKPAREEVAR